MNYDSLEDEKKTYIDLMKKFESSLSKLSNFFQIISKNGILFVDESLKAFQDFSIELQKEDRSKTINISFFNFGNDFIRYLNNIKQIFISMEKELKESINTFLIEFTKNSDQIIKSLSEISLNFSEKSHLEKVKYNYFESCKNLEEQKKKLESKGMDKNKMVDILSKYEKNSESQRQLYKKEITEVNKVIEENEERYHKIVNLFYEDYKNKNEFLREILCKFKTQFDNNSELIIGVSNKITKYIDFIDVKRDTDLFIQEYNFLTDSKKRFLNEQFLDYELIKKNNESDYNLNSKNILNNEINNNQTSSLSNSLANNISYEAAIRIINLGKPTYVNFCKSIEENENETNIKLNKLIFIILYSEKKIAAEDSIFLLNYVNNDKNTENIKNFMDIFIQFYNQENKFIEICNLDNMNLLSKLMILILTYSYNNKEIFEYCFFVIHIAENTIYFDKENTLNKQYLCKLLANKSLFNSTDLWKELLIAKISIVTYVSTRKETDKRRRHSISKEQSSGVLTKFKNMFDNSKNVENQKIENEILFGHIYSEKLSYCSVKVIQEYLKHFSNFNLEYKKISDIIIEMSTKYKFDSAFITYFMSVLNSNLYIKIEDMEIKEKNFANFSKIDYNKIERKIPKHITDPVIRIILQSINYLDISDICKIFALNSEINKNLAKYIYKNLLIRQCNNLSIEKHISIWKILLNYRNTKKKYDYNKIKDEVAKNYKNIADINTIEMDIVRTSFDSNQSTKQIITGKILKAIAYVIPSLSYGQGMNYIAAFFLNITDNEEESFYLFLSLLCSTEYGKLFKKDLEKLKKYFYVFERLICVLIPELYYHFKNNNINVSFFLSPWLITLFTNNYNIIKEKENPKILMRIIDIFILKGWKAIIAIGIALLKSCEEKLMNLTYENLLKYLINNVCNLGFFQNENFDRLMKITIYYKIESYLISNVESEYEIKKTVPKIGKKDIFEDSEDFI